MSLLCLQHYLLTGWMANAYANSTLLVNNAGLEKAKQQLGEYKQGKIAQMTPELWKAKKIVDSTLHPGMRRMAHLCRRQTCYGRRVSLTNNTAV